MRWQSGGGPGARRPALTTRLKRWLAVRLTRDARLRRLLVHEIFTHHAAPGILLRVPFPDHALFVDPRDDRIAATLLAGRAWQRDQLTRALEALRDRSRLTQGGTFLDIGANIGALTIYALLSGNFSNAVAIEPAPANRAILERNLAENGLRDRVTVIAAAATDAPGEARLHLDEKNLGAHSLEAGFSMSPGATLTVPADRLDSLLRENAVDPSSITLAKIDVEGHEFSVLEGATGLLGAAPPLMIEIVFDATADRDRLEALLPSPYSHCLDLDRAGAACPLTAFKPAASQHELLVF